VPYSQVAVGCKPAVEQDFPGAGPLTTVDSAEIQEVGYNRFLCLVRLVTGEHDDTRMCFVYFEIPADLSRGHFSLSRGHFSDLTGLFHGTILCRCERSA
jgi:hypothetical protein